MIFRIFLLIVFLFYGFSVFGFDFKDEPESVISTTSLTQDVSYEYDPDVQIITAKEIELYGVENLPDLLRLFAGLNVYRINASTAAVDVVGYADIFDSAPKILIDGRELEDPFITKNYLYNLSLSLEDIDRIEIVKGSSYYSDGSMSPSGIINIVTKSPELLDANYISVGKGADGLNKVNFSVNQYFWDTYFKITGQFRESKEYNVSEKVNESKFLNLSLTKFIGDKSLLTMNAAVSEGEGVFHDRFIFYVMNMPFFYPYNVGSTGLKHKEFFISYKYPSLELTFLFNRYEGNANADIYSSYFGIGKAKTDFYKFTLKKGIRFSKGRFIFGLEERYYKYKLSTGSPNSNIFTFYAKSEFNVNKNLLIRALVKHHEVSDYPTALDYFLSANLHTTNNYFGIVVSHSKSNKLSRGIYNHFDFTVDMTTLPNVIPNISVPLNTAYIYKSKDLDYVEFYSSRVKMFYYKGDVNFQTSIFYNKIKDMVFYDGSIDFATGDMVFIPKNYTDFEIVGIESSLDLKFGKNINFFISGFKQNLNVSNMESDSNFLIPSYKLSSGVLITTPLIAGGLFLSHVPKVEDLDGNSSDSYTEFDLNLMKKFLDGKVVCSAYVKNLFDDVHKETSGGLDMGRSYFIKIKYNF